ncbi:uncharacterized protein LOC142982944 [Anticarsia gemmatalis]|uniref:uncharacterized protein LOC142982944 n=1 Tax=Anticarsia gemmatalis TaxID=129554 RepID=UPI003F75F5CC
MTRTVTLVLAYSLLINEVHILFDSSILNNKYLTANLVYLLSLCLILGQFELIPRGLRRKSTTLCFFIEIPLCIILLELFLYYVWKKIQDYILLNADAILVHLTEERGLEWLVCHVCCGHSNCSYMLADLTLKLLSFTALLVTCFFVTN